MTIKLRLFAILKERAGADELQLDLREGASISDASALIAEKFPALRDHLRRAAFAVNREYSQQSTVLKHGDELAIIPPVSGGAST
jgi:molybdopterin converting factor subunit 1